MMIRIRGRRVVVKLPRTEERTDTGLWIPVRVQEPPMEGVVIGIGEGMENGVKMGDRVVFEQWAGLEVRDKDMGDVLILEYGDLMAVIDKEVN